MRLLPIALLAGCSGRHSWLAGAGAEARMIESLFWPLIIGAGLAWLAVNALAIFAYRTVGALDERSARVFMLWGGLIIPTFLVASVLVTGLFTLRSVTAGTPGLTLRVDGEQWWWRIIYETPDGAVETANEIRLPRGQSAEILLTSDDVIHSFWAPALGGKMDMVPGRTNRLTLTPLTTGNWGGLCAEYCGGAHAQMRFDVVVMERDLFGDWLAAEAKPAAPEAISQGEGLSVFLEEGCGACHSVRGTEALGQVGPDLTHLASRTRIAAGIRRLTRHSLEEWITAPDAVKPGTMMPAFPGIPPDRLDHLTAFLMALK